MVLPELDFPRGLRAKSTGDFRGTDAPHALPNGHSELKLNLQLDIPRRGIAPQPGPQNARRGFLHVKNLAKR